MIGAMVQQVGRTKIESMPETYELLRRYTGDVYTCTQMNASALADAASPQLWAKVPSGKKINFPTKRLNGAQIRYVEKSAPHWGVKSNVIDVVGTENVEQVLDHPVLDLLLNPNPLYTMTELWEIISIYLDLCGAAYVYKARKSRSVVELWPLPPALMRYQLDNTQLIRKWLYGRGVNAVNIDPADIMYFRRVSPLDAIKGYSPLRGILTPADASTLLMEYEKSLVNNRAVPDLIMTVRGVLNEDKIERHRKLWNDQFANGQQGGLALIPGDDANVVPLAWRPKDMENVKAYQQIRESICAAFGVPVSMLTMESSNRAVAEAGLFQMAKFSVKPRMNRLLGVLNRDLVTEFDDSGRLILGFPDPIPENRELVILERESNIRIGYTTPNEEREQGGLPPHPDGDELRTGETMEAPSQAESNSNDSASRTRSAKTRAKYSENYSTNGVHKNLEDEPGKPEALGMEQVMTGLFEAQRQVALEHVDKVFKNEEEPFDNEEWVAVFALALLPFYQRSASVGAMGARKALADNRITVPIEAVNADIDAPAQAVAKRAARSINRTTRQALKGALAAVGRSAARPAGAATVPAGIGGDVPGSDIVPAVLPGQIGKAIESAVNGVFDKAIETRAPQISRTETKRAMEAARRKVLEVAGITKLKWVSSLDATTCEFCREMNGKIVGTKQAFALAKDGAFVGASGGLLALEYGDIMSPPLHPNCRCVVEPVV